MPLLQGMPEPEVILCSAERNSATQNYKCRPCAQFWLCYVNKFDIKYMHPSNIILAIFFAIILLYSGWLYTLYTFSRLVAIGIQTVGYSYIICTYYRSMTSLNHTHPKCSAEKLYHNAACFTMQGRS